MALNIKPLSDRVLIEPVAAETKLLQDFYSRYSKRKPQKRNCCCREMEQKKNTMTVKLAILFFTENMLN
jgi:chaperonin GroES